jgi:hypothetical protein
MKRYVLLDYVRMGVIEAFSLLLRRDEWENE